MAPMDRRCRPWSLDNPLRRYLAPSTRELTHLQIQPGQTVADLGAGVGFFVEELLRRVGPQGSLYAVDPDPANLDQARRRAGSNPRVRFLVGSAAHVPEIPDGSVDRVLLSLVLCCMVDKEGAMDEAWRILRPGGLLYASYPRVSCSFVRRRPSLRVTPERWAYLVQAHPWHVLLAQRSWPVTRHLLARPPDWRTGPTDGEASPAKGSVHGDRRG